MRQERPKVFAHKKFGGGAVLNDFVHGSCEMRVSSMGGRIHGAGALWTAFFVLLVLACIFAAMPLDGQQPPTEYEVEAAYLFNFLKFVEWPDDLPADMRTHWIIGILGRDSFGEGLEQIVSSKTVQGRPIQIKRFQSKDDARSCHILFIAPSEKKSLLSILAVLRGSSVLVVADMDHFIDSGGMIQFIATDSHIRLAINLGAASRARLKISSKLLSLAFSVTSDNPGEKN
jgi:hypothetical protein